MIKTSEDAIKNGWTMLPASELMDQVRDYVVNSPPSVKLHNWDKFNQYVGGFRDKEFSILCGPSGRGKTTMVANISAQLMLQRVPHFVAPVESGPIDYLTRVLSVLVGTDINSGERVPKLEYEAIEKKYKPMFANKDLILSLYDNRFSVESLMNDLTKAYEVYGCKIAMIDNLNFFMEVCSSRDLIPEMDRVTHGLIMFCKEHDIHIVMVMHPRKTDDERVKSMFDIKGSSTSVQEAHNVFLFNLPTTEDEQNGYGRESYRELKMEKLRRRGQHTGRRILFKNENACYKEVMECLA